MVGPIGKTFGWAWYLVSSARGESASATQHALRELTYVIMRRAAARDHALHHHV